MAMTMAQEKPVQAGLAKRMTAQRKPRGRERPAFQNRPAGGQTPPRPQARQPQTATAGVRPVQSQYQTPGRPAAPSMGATRPQPQRPVGTFANQQYMGGSQQAGYRGFSPDYYAKMRAERAQQSAPQPVQGGYTGAQQPQTPQFTNGFATANPGYQGAPSMGQYSGGQMQPQQMPQPTRQAPQQGMDPRMFAAAAPQMANMNPMQLGNMARQMGQGGMAQMPQTGYSGGQPAQTGMAPGYDMAAQSQPMPQWMTQGQSPAAQNNMAPGINMAGQWNANNQPAWMRNRY